LGHGWAALPFEERKAYQVKAAAERERLAQELQVWKKQHGSVMDADNNAASNLLNPALPTEAFSPNATGFPLAKIRKICKLDSEVKSINKEAVILISRAAEYMVAKLGKETVKVAQIQNRRKLLPDDVALVCASHDVFAFLRDDIRDLVKDQRNNNAAANEESLAKKKRAAGSTEGEATVSNTKTLTDYFKAAP
jgi:DNA-directed RNA polymerase I subunit RPA43